MVVSQAEELSKENWVLVTVTYSGTFPTGSYIAFYRKEVTEE